MDQQRNMYQILGNLTRKYKNKNEVHSDSKRNCEIMFGTKVWYNLFLI